jgi:hypothetical protein
VIVDRESSNEKIGREVEIFNGSDKTELTTKEKVTNQLLRKHGFAVVQRQGREGNDTYISRLYDVLLEVLKEYLF